MYNRYKKEIEHIILKFKLKHILYGFVLCISHFGMAQYSHEINATLLEDERTINVQHDITFFNQTNDTINSIYLTDWNNAYASKNTALAKRFAEEFNKSLHLANDNERGKTTICLLYTSPSPRD